MKAVSGLLLLLVAVFSPPSWGIAATTNDGNKLLTDCGAAVTFMDGERLLDTVGASHCLGFIQGLNQMNDFYGLKGAPMFFCRPREVTAGQATRIVVKYLRDHPEELHKEDFVLVVAALSAAFPCTNKN